MNHRHPPTSRGLAVLAAVLLGMVSIMVGANAQSVSARGATAVTVKAKAASVPYGAVAVFSGKVTVLGSTTPLANRSVVVQRRVPGGAWASTPAVLTNTVGGYVKQVVVSRNMEYRVVVAPNAKFAGVVSRVVSVKAVPALTMIWSPSAGNVVLGQKVTVTGAVKPYLPTANLALQVYEQGSWQTRATGRIKTNGTYSLSSVPTTSGAKQYRVSVTTGKTTISNRVTLGHPVAVYRWHYLVDLTPAIHDSNFSFYGEGPAATNGVTYSKAYSLYAQGSYVEWNLNRQCTTFRATVGVSDADPSGTTTTLVGFADALEITRSDLVFGNSVAIQGSVVGALRIRLENEAAPTNGVTVLGNAQVLCLW